MQERSRWLLLAGLLLVVGVIGWRLTAGSYKTDIQKICFAEKGSTFDSKTDIRKIESWAKEQLDTPEASTWLTELVKKGMADRAKGLREESKRLGIPECPLAAAYEALNLDGEYRQDIASFCSLNDLPTIEASDDAERLHRMLDWIQTRAKSPRTKALGEKIAQADAKDRADVLREAANATSVFQCELVNTLLKPQTLPRKDEPMIELGTPQINGDLTVDKIVAAFLVKKDAMRKCYDEGLAKNAELSGRVMLKMSITPSGKVGRASTEAGTTLPDPAVVKCVIGVVRDLVFAETKSIMVSLLLPLEFVPRMRPVQMPMDPHGH